MSKAFYCHQCAERLGKISCKSSSEFTGSSYQLSKFYKHTLPSSSYQYVSVFDSPDFVAYKDYIVNAQASGSVEVDDQGRTSIVWVAGSNTGFTIRNGIPKEPVSGVKVVLFQDEGRVHAYPTGTYELTTALCTECKQPILR
jgi:hypothetical protein